VLVGADACDAEPRPRGDGPVEIDPDRTAQTIHGFGTCLISWVPELADYYRSDAFADFYLDRLGASMLRVSLWGPACPGPVEDPADLRFEEFDLDADGGRARLFLDVARKLKQRDPNIRIVGSVWSPPPWMKLNRSLNDTDRRSGSIQGDRYLIEGEPTTNRLDPAYREHFTRWIVEMVKLHAARGAPLDAVSLANEPMFTQWYESCVWTAADYARAVADADAALERAGFGEVKLFGPETMTKHNWAIANPLYVRELTQGAGRGAAGEPALDVFATHGYVDGLRGDPSRRSVVEFRRLIERHGRPFWISEAGTGPHAFAQVLEHFGAQVFNALRYGEASAFLPWQVVGGEGPSEHNLAFFEGGRERWTGKTHVAAHFFRHVRPGSRRVELPVTSPDDPLQLAAFADAARGALTLIAINAGDRSRTLAWRVAGSDERSEGGDTARRGAGRRAGDGAAPSWSRIESWEAWVSDAGRFQRPVLVRPAGGRVKREWRLTLPPESIATVVGRDRGSRGPSERTSKPDGGGR